MDRQATWIARTDALESALSVLGNGPLAIDTEADSLHHYPEKVCLIQLSFEGRDYLVDALAESDVVIAASGSPHHLISRKQLVEAMARRDGKPLVAIDIGLPRDFEIMDDEAPR